MTNRKTLRIALLSLGASLLASQAHAVAITDVSVQTSGGVIVNPSAAYLGQGKARTAAINGLTGLFAGDPWTKLDNTKKPSTTFNALDFVLTADTRQKSGNWNVTWGDSDLPQPMEFILVLKGGKKFGAYLLDSASIFSDPGSFGGLFQMSLLNQQGKIAKLRRATLFGRVAAIDDSTGGGNGGGAGGGGNGGGAGGGNGGGAGGGNGGGGLGGGSGGGGNGGGLGGGGNGGGSGGGSAAGTDLNAIPTPGSLILLLLGLGLWQLSRRPSAKATI